MNRILYFLLAGALLLAGMAEVQATDTALTAAGTLTGENSYVTTAYWSAAPTSTNTKYIAYDSAYMYFVIINATTVGTSPKLNILAGNNPPAFRAEIGNLAIPLTVNRSVLCGPLESARFLNTTKYLKFSTTNVTTATMVILKVLR
jgi:hypothetical protein